MLYAGIPGILMPIPVGWEDRSQLILTAVRDGFRHNLLVVAEDLFGRSSKDFIEDHINTLIDTLAGFSLRLEEPVTFGPHRGQLLDYDFTSGGRAYRQRQFFAFQGERVYCFTYSDTSDRFEEDMQAMEQIVGGTRFVDDGAVHDGFEV